MKIKPLDQEELSYLRSLILGTYLQPNCYALAIALYRGLGWPIVGIRQIGSTEIHHAAVNTPENIFFDARGKVHDFENLILPFNTHTKVGFELVNVTEQELLSSKPIEEYFIESTSVKAQSAWPELPWKNDTFKKHIERFAEELETLSRKHNLWIRAPFVTTQPIICDGDGDESYTLQPTADGSGYFINRDF